VLERTEAALQPMLDRSPQADQYYSDDFSTYHALVYYSGHHLTVTDRSQIYSVGADNMELRHYLARLAHKSRCIQALGRAIKLLVDAWNRRQLYIRQFPTCPAHVRDFIYPRYLTLPQKERADHERGRQTGTPTIECLGVS
jgi:IS1 family transposase